MNQCQVFQVLGKTKSFVLIIIHPLCIDYRNCNKPVEPLCICTILWYMHAPSNFFLLFCINRHYWILFKSLYYYYHSTYYCHHYAYYYYHYVHCILLLSLYILLLSLYILLLSLCTLYTIATYYCYYSTYYCYHYCYILLLSLCTLYTIDTYYCYHYVHCILLLSLYCYYYHPSRYMVKLLPSLYCSYVIQPFPVTSSIPNKDLTLLSSNKHGYPRCTVRAVFSLSR
jgi:hypothetical protein